MQGKIRIIGGTWRSRMLDVPAAMDLRPTPSRVRETLFNWLAGKLEGKHCLDAFAGSGALGFEAASRGASRVVMIEASAAIVRQLEVQRAKLQAEQIEIQCAKMPAGMPLSQPFDIAFLDPPYQSELLLPTCFYLETHGLLAPEAWIYLEAARAITTAELPAGWRLVKAERAGEVYYHLAQRK
jgi:16S rRNA (guanine966-N2)-methyltransferase